MANKKVFEFKGTLDTSDIISGLQKIRNQLGKNVQNQSIFGNIDKEFTKVNSLVTKLEAAKAKGFSTKKDVADFEKINKELENSFYTISSGLKNIRPDALKSGLKDLKSNLKEITTQYNQVVKAQKDFIAGQLALLPNGKKYAEVLTTNAIAGQDFEKAQRKILKTIGEEIGKTNESIKQKDENLKITRKQLDNKNEEIKKRKENIQSIENEIQKQKDLLKAPNVGKNSPLGKAQAKRDKKQSRYEELSSQLSQKDIIVKEDFKNLNNKQSNNLISQKDLTKVNTLWKEIAKNANTADEAVKQFFEAIKGDNFKSNLSATNEENLRKTLNKSFENYQKLNTAQKYKDSSQKEYEEELKKYNKTIETNIDLLNKKLETEQTAKKQEINDQKTLNSELEKERKELEKLKEERDQKVDFKNTVNRTISSNEVQTVYGNLKDTTGTQVEKVNQLTAAIDKQNKELSEENIEQGKVNQQIREFSSAANEGTAELKTLTAAQDAINENFDMFSNAITNIFSLTSAIYGLRRVITGALEDIKELDQAFASIAMVTDYSVSDMWKQYDKYAEMANELGQATKDVVKSSALYYQQGKLNPFFITVD